MQKQNGEINKMNKIILDKIIVLNNAVEYEFTIVGEIKHFFNNNKMFVEYNYEVSDVPLSILTIPFVANIIPLVWLSKSTLEVDQLDNTFYKCLENIKNGFENMYPNVEFKGSVKVNNLVENIYNYEHEAAQLFTGGVDAATTFIRIKDKMPYLITHNGWYKNDKTYNKIWDVEKKDALQFAKKYNLQNIFVESNYATFMNYENLNKKYEKLLGDNWWHGIHHGLALICTSIPIAYLLKIKTIYIASSFYEGYEAKCGSDPRIDNNIKYSSGNVFHDCYEHNRQEKIKILTDYTDKYNDEFKLKICFSEDENCCKCEKCMRTIMGIIAEGSSPNKFGIDINFNVSQQLKRFLDENIKYFTDSKIMIWNIIISRMKENKINIKNVEEFEWFLNYNLKKQRRQKLLYYRITNFIPILRRRIKERIEN